MPELLIEPEAADDAGRIRTLLGDAFPGEHVDRMVEILRASPGYEPDLALVARVDGAVAGFVMISHAELQADGGERRDVLNLSPLAVAEGSRCAGIGARLVRAALGAAERRPDLPRLVVLEGSPSYYGRLGFTPAVDSGVVIDLPDWAPPEAAQVHRLPGYDPRLRGRVIYPPAFDHDDADAAMPRALAIAGRLLGREVRGIRMLGGGGHAVAALVRDGSRELVVRLFPEDDPAVERELRVLPRLTALGAYVPKLVAADPAASVIVTSRVAGGPPDPGLPTARIAVALAGALARIHALDPGDLPPLRPPTPSDRAIGRAARADLERVDVTERVVVHRDAWCGNALWEGSEITGVVDWSGAGAGAPGFDVAWARNDLVLLGSSDAADALLAEYRARTGRRLDDIARWDRIAGAAADARVETWADNYTGIGREIGPQELRRRLDGWNARLLADAEPGG